MLTEDQAKEKWCPFARVAGGALMRMDQDGVVSYVTAPVAVNRGGNGSRDEVCCIASRCMAWRSHGTIEWKSLDSFGPEMTPEEKYNRLMIRSTLLDADESVKAHAIALAAGYDQLGPSLAYGVPLMVGRQVAPSSGFCGLAGKP